VRISGTSDLFARRAPPPGSRPGAIVLPPDTVPTRVRAMVYDAAHCEEHEIASAEELVAAAYAPGITWIDVQGLGDGAVLEWIRDGLEVHPLAVADAANVPQRPKFEDYGDRHLIVTQMAEFCEDNSLELEQLTLILGPAWVVSIQEHPGDCFDPLRERLRAGAGQIRRLGVDFLAYALVDEVIDSYFPAIEEIAGVLEDLEEEVIQRPRRATLSRVHAVRRTLIAMHRMLWRQRDALAQMMRSEEGPFTAPVRVYLRDAHDHSLQALDTIESYRELSVGLMDVYLSSVSNRLNEVMKTLTVMGTIFLPLSFIVGVYGMNFEYMPELHWHYGYYAVWVVMLLIAGGLVTWFWRRGWLERDPADPTEDDEPEATPAGAPAPLPGPARSAAAPPSPPAA